MLTLYIEMENLGVVVKTIGMRNLLFIQTDCVNIAVISWRRIRNMWWGKSNSLLANRGDKHVVVELISWCGCQLLFCDGCELQ